jgi:chemotaxis protein CheD
MMRTRILNINEIDITMKPVVYTCYGLGSCIGLFITDRLKGFSGGAHIPLPASLPDGEFLDAPHMIKELLDSFAGLGSNLNMLHAKVTGGANVYSGSCNIGEQNSRAVLQQLTLHKIYIAGTDLGGKLSRTARFNSITRELHISTSDLQKYCI